MSPKAIFELVRDTFKDWSEDKAARLGASLAYYTIFSIGPLLVIVISIASIVFDDAAGQVAATISRMIGPDAGDIVKQTIENANKGGGNIIATGIGIVTLLFGAAGVFGQLKDALNTIWEVAPKPGAGIIGMLKDRFLSFTMVLGTGFLLMVSLVVSAALTALGGVLSDLIPGAEIIGQIINFLVAFFVIMLMFALLFKFLPDVKIAWSDVWIGAAVTALLFLLGQFALAFYIASGNVGSAFGAASALVIILVWIYYSSQILFLGAEFTQVYTNRYGSRVRPAPNAEFITEEQRAQEGMPDKEEEGKGEHRDKEGAQKQKGKRLKASPWFR
ncbi:MAG TPA: YihY/virulence factor BrkB family protein [Chloroflexia bacterium]|nr:YihY/virulence factor BrkB family protein [Chloroflexia bacterium]